MKKKKILIVDDEAAFAKMVKLNLEQTGFYEVRVERFGTQAVHTATQYEPDLIILDMIMPDLDGEEVLNQIRSKESMKDVPVLFLSAYVADSRSLKNQPPVNTAGVMTVSKPISSEKLLQIIKDQL